MSTTEERVAELLARKPTKIHIACNGVWSADLADGGSIYSYEKLGLHTGCWDFLQCLWLAGVPFEVHGEVGKEFTEA
jgi:hypothetical protein